MQNYIFYCNVLENTFTKYQMMMEYDNGLYLHIFIYIKLSWLLIDNRIMLSVTMGFFVMNNKNTLISEMIVFSTIRSRSTKARALPNNVFWHGNRDFSYLTACNDLANIWSKQALISISYLIKVNICFQDLP